MQALLLGVALATAGTADVAAAGGRLVRDSLGEVVASLHTGRASVDVASAHQLLAVLQAAPPSIGSVPVDLLDALTSAILQHLPTPATAVSAALVPFLRAPGLPTTASVAMDSASIAAGLAGPDGVSLARALHDVGYGATASQVACGHLVAQISAALGRPFDERDVALALGMMIRHHGCVRRQPLLGASTGEAGRLTHGRSCGADDAGAMGTR